MLRDKLLSDHDAVDGFRWRGREITRIEGFSDAVFGFAVTLLVVSLEVPETSGELFHAMRGFGAFVVTFMMLAGIWYGQYTFFRRYGIEDRVTVVLNLILLFTVLFFIYPLKFLFSVLLVDPSLRRFKVETPHGLQLAVAPEHRSLIFLVFGFGFIAVFTVFILLYRHAYKQREKLGLNEFEIYETRHSIRRQTFAVAIGASYLALAGLQALPHKTPGEKRVYLGVALTLMLFFVVMTAMLIRLTRERKRVQKEWAARNQDPPPPDYGSS